MLQRRTTMSPSSTTLSPKAFDTVDTQFTDANFATVQYKARHATTANPVPHASVPTVGKNSKIQQLGQGSTHASTLLHELFHLVLGSGATYADVGEVYDVFNDKNFPQIVGLDYEYAVKNPESFSLAAVGYDCTINVAADANGNKIEFYSGYTTQG